MPPAALNALQMQSVIPHELLYREMKITRKTRFIVSIRGGYQRNYEDCATCVVGKPKHLRESFPEKVRGLPITQKSLKRCMDILKQSSKGKTFIR